jgi:hypothetical protein
MSNRIFANIKVNQTGYGHSDCYLRFTKNCSRKISSEHCVSKSVLSLLANGGKALETGGGKKFPGTSKVIGIASMTANILCTHHNSALHELDQVMLDFCKILKNFAENSLQENSADLASSIDCTLLERWLLKLALGLTYSQQIGPKSENASLPLDKWIKRLCNPTARWGLGEGLYLANVGARDKTDNIFEVLPLGIGEGNKLASIRVNAYGLHLQLYLINSKDVIQSFGVNTCTSRPSAIVFTRGHFEKRVDLLWHGKSSSSDVIQIISQ